jgi:hypothetical protein
MAHQMPEHGNESAWMYDDRNNSIIAFLCAVLLGPAIIGLFMFITWLAYATD